MSRPLLASLAVCALGAAGLVVAAVTVPEDLAPAWLFAFLCCLGPALGCVGITALHLLTGGRWGLAARPVLRAGLATLPALALAFLPLAAGLEEIFAWARPGATVDPVLVHKRVYLNPPFFFVRAAGFLALWSVLAFVLRRAASRPTTSVRAGAPRLGAAAALLYVLTMTFAAIDWAMSLDPHWFSSIYGARWVVGQGVSAVCLVLVVAAWPGATGVRVAREALPDVANLLLALVMLWAYLALSQFLVIWSGNLPEEVTWYVRRSHGGWPVVAGALAILHLGVPLALLLSRTLKRDPRKLGALGAGLLGVRVLDMGWLLQPSFDPAPAAWTLVAATAALGGGWCALFLRALRAEGTSPPARAAGLEPEAAR